MKRTYGKRPDFLGFHDVHLPEYMNYMYLPVSMGNPNDIRLPDNIYLLYGMVKYVIDSPFYKEGQYVYVTAKRGYATPDNPLNRPGWHSDGFGSDDYNAIWFNRYPTIVAIQEFHDISDDHAYSMEQFDHQINPDRIEELEPLILHGMSPSVIHAAGEIPAPGGDRQFVKISCSFNKYNLEGNSHNYLFDYTWKMFDRDEVRNDPIHAESDSIDF